MSGKEQGRVLTSQALGVLSFPPHHESPASGSLCSQQRGWLEAVGDGKVGQSLCYSWAGSPFTFHCIH